VKHPISETELGQRFKAYYDEIHAEMPFVSASSRHMTFCMKENLITETDGETHRGVRDQLWNWMIETFPPEEKLVLTPEEKAEFDRKADEYNRKMDALEAAGKA
jgi:hypothetical protein